MSFYLEIMGVPVERDTNCLTAPGAEMAVRLEAHQETVELRFHRMDGKTHCYLGLSDHLRVRQAKSILHANGFLVKDIQPPPGGMTTMLVRRMVNRRPLVPHYKCRLDDSKFYCATARRHSPFSVKGLCGDYRRNMAFIHHCQYSRVY